MIAIMVKPTANMINIISAVNLKSIPQIVNSPLFIILAVHQVANRTHVTVISWTSR